MAADRPKHRQNIRRLLGLAVIVGGIWLAGLFVFVSNIPQQTANPENVTDAIVVLTGGSGRLDEGLQLLAANRAKKLFISGVYRGVEVAEILEISQKLPGDFTCCVTLGYAAASTSGNARETADWISQNGFQSLRLVTANYHLPRSLLEFRHAMPDIFMVPHAVFPETFKREHWWAWPGSTALIVTEYMKYIAAWIRLQTTDLFRTLL